jgi:hypothetical protein
MIRGLRGKLASSISVIQEGEDFLHNSWLRVPVNNSVPIGNISSRLLDTSHIIFDFEKPFLSKLFFKLGKTTLYPEDLNYLFGKIKTNAIFFQLLHVASKIINHPDIKLNPSDYLVEQIKFLMEETADLDVGDKFNLLEPTDYLSGLTEPDIPDYLQNLEPKVKKIELLKFEKIELLKIKNFLSEGDDTVIEEINFLSEGDNTDIEEINFNDFGIDTREINIYDFNIDTREINVGSFRKPGIIKLKVEKISKPPKLFKIKVPGMGKIKTTASTFDLLSVKIVEVSKSPLLIFTPPSVSSQSLSFLSFETVDDYVVDVQEDIYEPEAKVDEVNESKNESEEIKSIQRSEESEPIEEGEESETIEEGEESETIEESEELETLDVSEELESVEESETLEPIQKITHKVVWKKRRDPGIILNNFEEENVRFLAENDRAFLTEEPGLHKIKEAFVALKFLFENEVINSTLIVIPAGFLGHSEKEKQLGDSLGWIGNLEKYCYDMSYSVIFGDDNERLNAWNKSALIHIVDHKTFLNDHSSNILEKQRLANFDCVIIDEVQELLESSDKNKNVLKEINSNIFWALSSIVGENILSLLNDYLNDNCRIKERKVQFLANAGEEHAIVNHEEFWLEPNENQRVKYKETLVECRKELKKVLESGNPFMYQSNIFILIHKLFQVQNYAPGMDTSPKSNLLIQHIKAIEKNLKKVIVISQYDRQGTKQIEALFDQHEISYINVPTSLSNDEIEKAISLFKSKKSVTVFLTNAKISRFNFKDFVVPYIIRFDSWWNPAALWQTKNLFDLSKSNNENRVNVFTYKMLDTIDELIKRTLISKNYIDDNIISAMSPATVNDIISVDEWLNVFDMPVNDEQENNQELYEETVEKLNNLSLEDYRKTLSSFFLKLGYAKIKILKHENSESFDITGEGKSGTQKVSLFSIVLLDKIITMKKIKKIIVDVSLAQKNNTFIITRGKFKKGCTEIAKNNVTLLDVEKLAAYLVNLRLVS